VGCILLSVFVRQWRSLPKISDPKIFLSKIFGKTVVSSQTSSHGLSGRTGWLAGCHLGLASLLLLMGAGSVHDATASNETRTLSFHHTHSSEDLTITFKRDGRYDEDALKKLNHFLRDWRSQDETVMDRHLFDILWEVYRDVDARQPIQIVSAYRSPGTNAMLRRRSAHTGVARHSQHMLGHAMDFYIPGVPLEQIRFAGLRLQRGGVGFYPTSGSPFVHLDSGNIRHWPRMTHDQLVRVFPDGRTVHIPSDGVPLKGYELARADIEKRGNGDEAATFSAPSLLARLFRGKSSEDDDESATESDAKFTNARFTQVASTAPAATTDTTTSASRSKLGRALQLASADTQLIQPVKSKPTPDAAAGKSEPSTAQGAGPQSLADIINARGFWGDNSGTLKQATPEQVAAITARRAAIADPQSTGSTSVMNAMAFAPLAASPADRTSVVVASAPISARNRSSSRNATPSTDASNGAAKEPQAREGLVTNATRISAAKDTDTSWMRVMMLAPSATRAMSVTMLGDPDLTVMRSYFVKPQSALTISFSDDATPGLTYDQFTGVAAVKLETRSFAVHAAALH
jgi:uncharacterized protein YcbK (DUF882 family)